MESVLKAHNRGMLDRREYALNLARIIRIQARLRCFAKRSLFVRARFAAERIQVCAKYTLRDSTYLVRNLEFRNRGLIFFLQILRNSC